MIIYDIITNEVFLTVAIAFITCQLIKLVTKSYEHGKFYLKGLIEDGGMPSTHTTSVVALSVSVGFVEGFVSTLFLVVAAFSLVVMRDAMGIRHNVDLLTKKVNENAERQKLKPLSLISGHTRTQVTAGLVLGIVVSIIVHFAIF